MDDPLSLIYVSVYALTGLLIWRQERYAIDTLGLVLSIVVGGTLVNVLVWSLLTLAA